MREIKFRAWNGEEMILPPFGLDFIQDGHIELTKWVEENEDDVSNGNTNFGCTGESDDCTLGVSLKLMQFTGLKDKNGVEIYEGDVLNIDDNYNLVGSGIHEVVFNDGSFCIDDDCPISTLHNSPGCDTLGEGTEVVGNIYENPDLAENL